MIPSNSKLTGPVKLSNPDFDTVILSCDRSLKWPAIFGLSGILVLLGSAWSPAFFLVFAFYGVPAIIAALYFAVLRANVVLSKKNGTLELKPLLPLSGRDAGPYGSTCPRFVNFLQSPSSIPVPANHHLFGTLRQ
jgi:hypothetical protein